MHIDSIELFRVCLPLGKSLVSALGPVELLDTVLVRMRSGEMAGWGEASPGTAPLAGADWAAGTFACLKQWMAPLVCGKEITSGQRLGEHLQPFRENRFAKAALDMAWWDLHARLQAKPLHGLLDPARGVVEIGTTFDQMESAEEFLAAIGRAFEAGYARVRLMLRPGWDIQMVDAVRKEYPVETIHVDAAGAMGLEHLDTLQRLDDFGLAMIEQPLRADDLIGHAMVQDSISTPLCLDESITGPERAEVAIELESCRSMNVQPGRVGGLTPAIAIHDACQEAGIACFVGAMPQTGVGTRFGLALAAKENFSSPADYFPAEGLIEHDLTAPLIPMRHEKRGPLGVALWSEPGIGIDPDTKTLEKYIVDQAAIA